MPGPETLIEIGKSAQKTMEEAGKRADERLASKLREAELEAEAKRQADWRKLLWAVLAAIGLLAGSGVAFWDDWVRLGVRVEQLESPATPHRDAAPAEEKPGLWGRLFRKEE